MLTAWTFQKWHDFVELGFGELPIDVAFVLFLPCEPMRFVGEPQRISCLADARSSGRKKWGAAKGIALQEAAAVDPRLDAARRHEANDQRSLRCARRFLNLSGSHAVPVPKLAAP